MCSSIVFIGGAVPFCRFNNQRQSTEFFTRYFYLYDQRNTLKWSTDHELWHNYRQNHGSHREFAGELLNHALYRSNRTHRRHPVWHGPCLRGRDWFLHHDGFTYPRRTRCPAKLVWCGSTAIKGWLRKEICLTNNQLQWDWRWSGMSFVVKPSKQNRSVGWLIHFRECFLVQALLHLEPILIVPQLIRLSSRAESFNSVLSKQSWFPAK